MLLDWSSYHGLPWGFSSPSAALGTSQPPYLCEINHEYIYMSFPGLSNKESTASAGDAGLIPGLGRIPWRRKWQPIPVFLPWTEEPGRLQSMGSQKSQTQFSD